MLRKRGWGGVGSEKETASLRRCHVSEFCKGACTQLGECTREQGAVQLVQSLRGEQGIGCSGHTDDRQRGRSDEEAGAVGRAGLSCSCLFCLTYFLSGCYMAGVRPDLHYKQVGLCSH